jgi:hypothetical protein
MLCPDPAAPCETCPEPAAPCDMLCPAAPCEASPEPEAPCDMLCPEPAAPCETASPDVAAGWAMCAIEGVPSTLGTALAWGMPCTTGTFAAGAWLPAAIIPSKGRSGMAWGNSPGVVGASAEDRLAVGNSLMLADGSVSKAASTSCPQCPQKRASPVISKPQDVQRCKVILPLRNASEGLPVYTDIIRSTRERDGCSLTARNISNRLCDCYLYRLTW